MRAARVTDSLNPRLELSFRARRILYAVVAEYVATGEPVGSRRLAKRYGLNLSPASIRNVLADLEDAGFLSQPHTSAGRIPTERGFRTFVDALVQMRDVTSEDRAAILHRLEAVRPGQGDVLREVGRLLSALTGVAAIVAEPRPEEERLSQLRFLPLRPGEMLAVMVTRSGVVQNRVVPVVGEVDPSEIERLHNYLQPLVENRTLMEVREALARDVASDRDEYTSLRRRVWGIVDAAVAGAGARGGVWIEGQHQLFGRPEFASGDKIRSFLTAFEDRETLLELLDRTLVAGGVQVLIGSEARLGDVDDISLISASFRRDGSDTGSIGVIGPARMDYAKVVPLVSFTAKVVSDLLGGNDDAS